MKWSHLYNSAGRLLRLAAATAMVSVLVAVTQAQNSQFLFDEGGNLTQQSADITAAPQILAQPQNQVVIPGEAASFSVVVADTRNVSYQWFFNGTAISGANSDSLLLTNVSINNQGTFSVVVANGSGSIPSSPAALMIDSRGCGMPDSWQLTYFGNLNQNASGDFDGDGVPNLQEFLDGTNPTNAASVLYRIALLNDGGSVVIVPDQPAYSVGQVVTLTAIGSESAPFHAWTGDVTSRSNSITLTITTNISLFAHFEPLTFTWTNTLGGDWSVPSNWTPNLAPSSNESVVIAIGAVVTLNSDVDLLDLTCGAGNIGPELTGTGVLTIQRACSWSAGTMSGTGATVVLPGGTLTVNNTAPIALNNRTLENGGIAVWSGGGVINIDGGVITNDAGALFLTQNPNAIQFGGGSPEFDNAGTFLTASNGTTGFNGVSFNNYGTVGIQGGTFFLNGGGVNDGVITVPAETTINIGGSTFTSSSGSSITGAGTLMVNADSATLAGTIHVSGSNVFNNGSIDFTGNYVCTNNTMVISGGGVSFDGTGPVSPAVLDLSNGNLGGAQNVTVTGAMNWTGGGMAGTGWTVIPPGVTLTAISGQVYMSIVSRTLDIGGTALWSVGNLSMLDGVITNEAEAIFQMQSPGTFNYGGGSPRFDNAGTLNTTGSGTMNFAGIAFNNYGTVNLQGGTFSLDGSGINDGLITVPSGTTIDIGGSSFTSSSGSSITGAGTLMVNANSATLAGTINVSGSNVFNNGSIDFTGNYVCTNNTMIISGATASFDGTGTVSPAVLDLSNGNLGGAQTVIVTGAMNWTGGGMVGTGWTVIPPGVTLTAISGQVYMSIITRTLDIRGTTLWSVGNLSMVDGVITNEAGALFQMQSSGAFNFGGGSPRFDNDGIVRTTGSGTMSFAGLAFNNYGTVNLQGGTFSLGGSGINNGVITVPSGTTINIGGSSFNSSSGSSITGGGTLIASANSATLAGTINVSGSNVFNNGSIDFTGNYVCTNNTMVISGSGVSFDGTGVVSPAVLDLINGNLGGAQTVTVTGAMNWTGGGMVGTGRTVIPRGVTLTAISGQVYMSIISRTLDIGGTTLWSVGNLSMLDGVITNEAGALFQMQSPGAFNFGGGLPRFDNAGTFRKLAGVGAAAINLTFTNYGTVDIEGGVLAAASGYVSSSNAVLNCAIAGPTNYGQLDVSGSVTLNGALSVNLTNNYIPTTNDSFTVLMAGTCNGTFDNFIYPSNKVALSWSTITNSVIVSVTKVLAVPQPLLLPLQLSGSNIVITWMSVSNTIYRVEYNPSLDGSNWNALPGDVTAVTSIASKLDPLTPTNRFYQILVVP